MFSKAFIDILKDEKLSITIDGGIGVGKSTLGRSLEKKLKKLGIYTDFYPEPFNQKMLKKFLGDMKKYAYAFQLYMLTRRQLNYIEVHYKELNTTSIMDRSLTGDFVFATLQNKYGNINDSDFEDYKEEYYKFDKYQPDIVIYLQVDIDNMRSRIAKRNRDGEDTYNYDYLDELQKQHTVILNQHIPVNKLITVDWNNDVLNEEGDVKDEILNDLLHRIEYNIKIDRQQ